MARIAHARCDENGKIDGPMSGDQTGKEVRFDNWYENNWTEYIEAKDPVMREHIAREMELAVQNNKIGYSQKNRMKGALSAIAIGTFAEAEGDVDCSSAVNTAVYLSGGKVNAKLATSTMLPAYESSGQFTIYTDVEHLKNPRKGRRGGIYLRRQAGHGHVFVLLEDGPDAGEDTPDEEASDDETGSIVAQIIVDGGVKEVQKFINVRSGPGLEREKIGKAYKNEQFDVYGNVEGWYKIDFHGSVGYVWYELVSEVGT